MEEARIHYGTPTLLSATDSQTTWWGFLLFAAILSGDVIYLALRIGQIQILAVGPLLYLCWVWLIEDMAEAEVAFGKSYADERPLIVRKIRARIYVIGTIGIVFAIIGLVLGIYMPAFWSGALLPLGLAFLWRAQHVLRKELVPVV